MIKPAFPVDIKLKMFVKQYAIVNINDKPEPLIIKVQGVPSDVKIFNVFLSTSQQFPNEKNNTIVYRNKRRMEFYIRGGSLPITKKDEKQEPSIVKFTKKDAFIAFELE